MVALTVHRATREIGGNCIEIAHQGARILLDVGRPLEAPPEAEGLLAATLDRTAPVAGVLISHAHQDHYGLLSETPADWPVWCGAPTAALIRASLALSDKPCLHRFQHWKSGQLFHLGPFTIRPLLTDHSAFDAHMLEIEVAGRRIFYSGDFRRHGRKGKLVEALLAKPPAPCDVLLLEGTNLGSTKPHLPETALEDQFVSLFRQTTGRVFVQGSAQNIDRMVTLFRACRKTGRTLVIDLYAAFVLEALAMQGTIPQPDWSGIRVVFTRALADRYRKLGHGDFVDRMVRPNGISARAVVTRPGPWVILLRKSLMAPFARSGLCPGPEDRWVWSSWRGYLDTSDGQAARDWFAPAGLAPCHIHTSGHAAPQDLLALAQALQPRRLVPIHGAAWDDFGTDFPAVHRLRDGETLEI